jgi:hypothetical protein
MQYQPPYGAPGADDPYVNGDPSIARQGSIIPAAAVEFPQREVVALISRSNMTPTDDDLEQLTAATRSQFVNFCVDTGSANNLSVALAPPLLAYKQGLPLRVLVANANTGPCTINVNGLGGRPIRRPNGAELTANDIVAGMIASLVDDGTAFQLANFQAAAGTGGGGSTTNNYTIKIPYTQDTSPTPNLITAVYTPPITAVVPGDPILVRVANTNTGAVQIAVNALAQAPIRRNDGQPLQGRDILAGEILLLEWNITYWQCLRLVRSQVIIKLTADLTLYVRPDGNDSNDGSANDPAHAFKTPQAAIEFVKSSFLIAGRTVTVQLGVAGSYTGGIDVRDLPGSLVIKGDANNRAGYVVLGKPNATEQINNPTITISGSGSNLTCIGFTATNQDTHVPSPNLPGTNIIDAWLSSRLHLQDMQISGTPAPKGSAVAAFSNSSVTLGGYIDLLTTVDTMFNSWAASIEAGVYFTLINTHGLSFAWAFCSGTGGGYLSFTYGWTQFSGGAAGRRYALQLNSSMYTNSAPSNYLPGNQPGTVDASSAIG